MPVTASPITKVLDAGWKASPGQPERDKYVRYSGSLCMLKPFVPPELLDPVVAYFQPRRVIVFGSVARGEAGPDSDIDLLVVVDDDTPPERLTLRAGIASRMSYRHPADVIPCRETTFRDKARIAGTLAYEAVHAGHVVYERR